MLSIAPSYGLHKRSMQIAKQLANLGIEVWQIDLADSLFLPQSTELMRSLTGRYVADLIKVAQQQTDKKIILSTSSYGAIPLLRGARLWQLENPNSQYLIGAILFSPDLYTTVPSLGLPAEYLPIASATNIPIMIFQDGIRSNRWYVDNLVDSLKIGGSQPFLKILPGVSALFFDEDEAPETLQALAKLPQDIKASIVLLEKMPTPRKVVALTRQFKTVGSGIDVHLKPFKGKFLPYAIDLKDAAGKRYQRKDYKDHVTIINFWATWCPSCVEEIPSLNRLKQAMRDIPFDLISVNYAEKPDTVLQFLKEVDAQFPVLMDESGQISRNWKVIAFPSTFVIGPDGKIHYGVNAGIRWDDPSVVNRLRQLYAGPNISDKNH